LAGRAIKLYKRESLEKRREELRAKIIRMLDSPPENCEIEINNQNLLQFAWPLALVEDDNHQFCGFVQPLINQDEYWNLKTYITEVDDLEWRHLSITERVQVARNIAGALYSLHKVGHFFIDMKPENIQVHQKTSTVVFLDTDGFSIGHGEFPAKHITPGYIAPEMMGKPAEECSNSPTQDHYVLSVLIFLILNYGIGPWEGIIEDDTLLPNSEDQHSDTRARHRLYAYGLTPRPGLTPPPLSIFKYWPRGIRELFDRAFLATKGSERPTAEAWFQELDGLVKRRDFEKCIAYPDDERHRHFKDADCFACELFRLQALPEEETPPRPPIIPTQNPNEFRPKEVEEPTPPSHWVDILPIRYTRMRSVSTKLQEGSRLPTSFNLAAGSLQFLWLFFHGLVKPGLTAGGIFLSFATLAIWNPNLLPIAALGIVGCGMVLAFTGDYLLYRRIDNRVIAEGGFHTADEKTLVSWIGGRHGGWYLGPLVLLICLSLAAIRFYQVTNARAEIEMAIQTTDTLKANLNDYLIQERKAGRTVSLADFIAKSGYSQRDNSSATIMPQGDKLVLVLLDSSLAKGKKVMMQPVFGSESITWYCWAHDVDDYIMPDTCKNRYVN